MCGIFGYLGGANATTKVFAGLKNLEYRGYDSWGIVALSGGELITQRQVGKIGQSKLSLGKSSIALGHTRWATHGGVTIHNSHPHFDCHHQLAVVHNGIIENYESLKQKLVSLGHTFISDTDTEVFAHLVEEKLPNLDFVSAVKASFGQITGLNTLGVLSREGDLVACRNGSPLVLGRTDRGEIIISSDLPSLLSLTHDVAVLRDGEFVVVKQGELLTAHIFDHISMDVEVVAKGSYKHFYLKEIHDQVEAISRRRLADAKEIQQATSIIKKAKQIYAVGCGTAYYAMLTSSYLLAKYLNVTLVCIPANEFGSFAHLLDSESVVICASQSGETIDTIEAIRASKSRGATTIGLINVPGSTLEREVDICLSLLAGVEKAVVSSKAFTNMLATIYLLAGEGDKLTTIGAGIEQYLSNNLSQKRLKVIAKRLAKWQSLFVIGRGPNYPIALEGALKLKEISYLHAEGLAAGELKHGVIALIELGTPCLVIVAQDSERSAVLSSAMELKARGAWIIGVGGVKESVFDDWIQLDPAIDSPILSVIPFQLLGYFLALEKGLDPDMPRNLAKSVTVK